MSVVACFLAIAFARGDVLVIEHASPGLVPSIKFSAVNLYARELRFTATLDTFPLLAGTPTAIASLGTSFVLAEQRCQGSDCRSQLVRYDADGSRTELGQPVPRVSALRPDGKGGLLIASLPVADFDVDASGTVAAVIPPQRIVLGNSDLGLSGPLSEDDWFSGIRFSSEGDLIVSSRGRIHRITREGIVLATFDAHLLPQIPCRLDVERDVDIAVVACGDNLLRLDLKTGQFADPIHLHSGVSVDGLAMVPPSRRRPVTH